MKRRTFLKGVAAILAAAVSRVPILPPRDEQHAELEAEMRSLYAKLVRQRRAECQEELYATLERDLWAVHDGGVMTVS